MLDSNSDFFFLILSFNYFILETDKTCDMFEFYCQISYYYFLKFFSKSNNDFIHYYNIILYIHFMNSMNISHYFYMSVD